MYVKKSKLHRVDSPAKVFQRNPAFFNSDSNHSSAQTYDNFVLKKTNLSFLRTIFIPISEKYPGQRVGSNIC